VKQFETLKDTDASNYILPSAKFNIRIFSSNCKTYYITPSKFDKVESFFRKILNQNTVWIAILQLGIFQIFKIQVRAQYSICKKY
jgi:hypothetical protein